MHALSYGLTYTYSGYPLVSETRARIAAGMLGMIRQVNFAQIFSKMAQDDVAG